MWHVVASVAFVMRQVQPIALALLVLSCLLLIPLVLQRTELICSSYLPGSECGKLETRRDAGTPSPEQRTRTNLSEWKEDAAQGEADLVQRYAYGVAVPRELPSPPPAPVMSTVQGATVHSSGCESDPRYDRYLKMQAHVASHQKDEQGYLCYRHRDVQEDSIFGRRGCKPPFSPERCPVLEPTFPAKPGGCLCCKMAGKSKPSSANWPNRCREA